MPTEAPRLFPFPLVEGVEGLHARHRNTGRAIYLTVIAALLLAAGSLPLIEVDVNSSSRGVLRPSLKHSPVSTAVGGTVTFANLPENGAVTAGDTLLSIATSELTAEARHLNEQLSERRRLLSDLQRLLTENSPTLATAVYQRDYREYLRRSDELDLRLTHARRQLERQQQLMQTGSVARMELEQAEHDVRILEGQQQQLRERERQQWTEDRHRIRRELADRQRQINQLAERAERYTVVAPVSGQLTQTTGLQAGAHVAAGQNLAQISPDGALRVEVYVSPNDIGLLREGQSVRLQLDAFNYNQWGMAEATVSEIGRDVSTVDGQAAFRVVCTLHDRELRLKNGYVGTLRKGMTLTAHFTLTRRTLFQLLHDKVDDWFNPSYN
jgi:HlyD family secretion protein